MGYRKIPEDKILKFPATPGFKGWKDHFTADSITHPAKMNLNLLRWILKTYTKPGEIVLDPMAGTGSTIVLASLLGRHGVAVEYEPQFCKMIDENINRTRVQSSLMSKGAMTCIQGDARELSKMLGGSDAIITSSPYEATCLDGRDVERRIERLKEAGHDPRDFIGGRARGVILKNYDKVDAVVLSPPYADSIKRGDEGPTASGKDSPTYDERLEQPKVYSNDPKNIGNLRHGKVDSIVTSPPYEAGPFDHAGGHGGAYAGGIASRDPKLKPVELNDENIGSMKGETYLEAMLKVYRECHKVLKLGRKMILSTKNFIRDKAVVRLDEDTIRLCEAAGFTLRDRWYFKLPTRSFWRILYRRKYPDVPEIEYEDVLVFEKRVDILDKSRGPPRV